MVSWISSLCALCAMSALVQMMLPKGSGRDAIRMICGLLMLRLTCESAAAMLVQLQNSTDLSQMFSCLIK